jgi:hypothetical protein
MNHWLGFPGPNGDKWLTVPAHELTPRTGHDTAVIGKSFSDDLLKVLRLLTLPAWPATVARAGEH